MGGYPHIPGSSVFPAFVVKLFRKGVTGLSNDFPSNKKLGCFTIKIKTSF